jgi:nitrate reductase NapD
MSGLVAGGTEGDSFHVASLLVQARPHKIPALIPLLEAIAGVEVHHGDSRGRMILTVEAADDSALIGAIGRIERTYGVITASLVYHQVEDADHEE